MRIFDEITKEIITNPDYENGHVYESNNPIVHKYIVDTEEEGHYETIKEYPNGGKDVKWIVDVPEEGHWIHEDSKGEFDWTGTMPEDAIKTEDIYDNEIIGLYHTYSSEEKEAIAREVEEQEEKAQQALADRQLLNELPEFENDTDTAICDLFELIIPTLNKLPNNYSAIAKAYARRILRGEITLEDVPEIIREEVREILEENK